MSHQLQKKMILVDQINLILFNGNNKYPKSTGGSGSGGSIPKEEFPKNDVPEEIKAE